MVCKALTVMVSGGDACVAAWAMKKVSEKTFHCL
jgi:hypothetical protein